MSPQRLSILREIRYEDRTKPPQLVSSPLPELSQLHVDLLYSAPNRTGLTLAASPGGWATAGAKLQTLISTGVLAARAMDFELELSLVSQQGLVPNPIHVGLAMLSDPSTPALLNQSALVELSVSAPHDQGTRKGILHPNPSHDCDP